MKAVVTGANSFIGQRMCRRLLQAGWQVTAVMRQPFELPEGVTTLLMDMESYDHLGSISGGSDCFLHLAWNGTRGATRMDKALQEHNADCGIAAVRSMLAAGCKKIVTAGSQAEYGPHADIIDEHTECAPNTEYGKAKLLFYREALSLCTQAGAECVEPRFFSLYGPDDYAETMIMSILRDMLADRPCRLTQGIQMWDYLYIDDAVEALVELCGSKCPSGVYNFGSGDTRQLRDYVKEMERITGTKSELLFGAIPYPETGMVSLCPDISKLKRELNWKPKTSFSDGVRILISQMKSEGIL